MCGIAGMFSFGEPAATLVPALERSLALVARRGPDDTGTWTDHRRCLLGFRRLAVLDLTPAGRQPLVSTDGRFALVCNGEIYNFRELRGELERAGVRSRSTGDAEVVLHALMQWGVGALPRLHGMFALAFFDTVAQRLLLARDHVGMKPLYLLRTVRGVAFGSQYDQLMSHPWARGLALDPAALGLYLRFDYVPAPYAAHDGLGMLEPGTWMSIEADGVSRSGRYFDLEPLRAPDLRGGDACDAIAHELGEAVRRHVVSDVPVGTFLSGGIDSPLIAAMMQADSTRPVPAFTLGLPGEADDESGSARAYARELGVEHVVCDLSPGDVLPLVHDALEACAEPFADFSVIPTLLIAREARRRVTVMLSGDGGDELFWGYAQRSVSTLRLAPAFRWPRWWRALRWSMHRTQPGLLQQSVGHYYMDRHQFVRSSVLRGLLPDLPDVPPGFTTFSWDGWDEDLTARWMRGVELTLHLPRILMKVDRASMYHSLEVRMPLLDRRVVDLAMRIDWRSCLDAVTGRGKVPLRAALARRVAHPAEGKRGFTVPMDAWMRGPLRSAFEDMVLPRRELAGISLRRSRLAPLYRDHLEGRASHGWLLWRLFSLASWCARHPWAAP